MTPVPFMRLADVCDINPRMPRDHGLADDAVVSFVPMAAVDEVTGTIATPQTRTFAEVRKGFTSFRDGDVLFAKITPCMENGKAALAQGLVGGVGFGSTEFHVLRASGRVLPSWLRYFVRRESFRLLAKRNFTGTAGQQRVPAAYLSNAQLPVPPLEAQGRIVDLLSRAEGIVCLRREAQAKAEAIIPALFHCMFGDPATNPRGWEESPLRSLVQEFRYGTSNKSGATGLPTLRIPNVVGNRLDPREMKLVPVSNAETDRLRLLAGDLLFVRTNGNPDYVGRSAVFEPDVMAAAGFDASTCIFASYLIRARLAPAIRPVFLQSFLSSHEGRKRLREQARTSAGQYNINTEGLGSIGVPVPQLKTQAKFEERSRSLLGIIAQQTAALNKAEATFQALLSRAFSGDLTPAVAIEEAAGA